MRRRRRRQRREVCEKNGQFLLPARGSVQNGTGQFLEAGSLGLSVPAQISCYGP